MNLSEIIKLWGECKIKIPFITYKGLIRRLKTNRLVVKEYKEKYLKK
tara:strand:- start:152 stop:292 length:141 start_codon:yes stop_codon:yes gene_type:complete